MSGPCAMQGFTEGVGASSVVGRRGSPPSCLGGCACLRGDVSHPFEKVVHHRCCGAKQQPRAHQVRRCTPKRDAAFLARACAPGRDAAFLARAVLHIYLKL